MTQEMPNTTQKVNAILFEQWDPLDINGYSDARRDEYLSYAKRLVDMASHGRVSEKDIVDFLTESATDKIEFEAREEEILEVTRQLIQVFSEGGAEQDAEARTFKGQFRPSKEELKGYAEKGAEAILNASDDDLNNFT